MRIFLVDILTFHGFFGVKFDILKPRWLPTSTARFAGTKDTHAHEEKLRAESMAIIESDPEFGRRVEMIEKAMAIIFTFTIDHTSRTVDENTAQMLGVRLFNAAGTGLKLALSGYYQTAFHQARDIMETGFLLDYFRTSPCQISVWRTSDRATRRKFFDPVKIRIALDDRDKDTEKSREAEYNKPCLSGCLT